MKIIKCPECGEAFETDVGQLWCDECLDIEYDDSEYEE